jgi:hypothetical protein
LFIDVILFSYRTQNSSTFFHSYMVL